MTAWRFVLFNLIGAAIWAPLVAGAGFLSGRSLQWLFADIQRYEVAALVLLVALSLLTAWWRSRRHRRQTARRCRAICLKLDS